MKHLLKKLSVAGAGGKADKPKPPIYKPPVMGELQYGASHSYAETLDLLSDGPIEGLVNSHGELVDGLNVLQGIYLDDTPVAVTNQSAKKTNELTLLDAVAIDSFNMELNNPVGATYLSKFFQELKKVTDRSSGGRITSLKSSTAGGVEFFEGESWPDVSMFFLRTMEDNQRLIISLDTYAANYGNPHPPTLPKKRSHYALFIRGFIKYRGPSPAQTFPWYLNETLQSTNSDLNAAYRNDAQPKGEVQDGSSIWGDNTLASSKFLFAFNPSITSTSQLFANNATVLNTSIQGDLDHILELYTGGEGIETNKWQKDLADRALSKLGWNKGNVQGLLSNYLNKNKLGGVAICKVTSSNTNLVDKQILDGDALMGMETLPYGFADGFNLIARMENTGITVTDVTCPEISETGVLNGEMHGFLIFEFPVENDTSDNFTYTSNQLSKYGKNYTFKIPSDVIDALKDLSSLKYAKRTNNSILTNKLKFNYSNILAEIRKGEESQSPFNNFKKIFIDHHYGRELFGPFGTAKASSDISVFGQTNTPQRIVDNIYMLSKKRLLPWGGGALDNFNTRMDKGLPISEGSDDERWGLNYSDWGENSLSNFEEEPISVVHIIYNPNVEEVFITLDVSALKDTLIRNVDKVRDGRSTPNQKDLKIGTTFPAILNISVETGSIGKKSDSSEGQIPFKTHDFRIVALIEGNTMIDIGNPDYKGAGGKEYVALLNSVDDNLNPLSQPFQLPPNETQQDVILTSSGLETLEAGNSDEAQTQNRYVKVTKLSYETNSVLLDKVVAVNKITEIINADLSYPYSAIVGTKLDSRSFSSIPKRSYDCKLKKVKVPSNYFPTNNGIDKRYYDSEAEFDNASQKNKLIYKGDWNGSFHDTLQWTDNPAWILYDLLTNNRYGMGSHISIDQINKWQLYKIGRFCDNVDNEGYFLGVTDGKGGKEPRFSCNIVFDQGEKIFDAINTIAALFRGRTFFSNSEINFVDDRPRDAINFFTNESVKDGLFFYSNNRRDEQFNTIEIGYKDRFNSYEPKIEVVEDEEDIKERGIFKKRIDGIGITSRAMARRAAEHQIFSKIKENQQVAFTAGLETLLCKPGDLVIIEDELKTNITNFGKVLDVNLEDETIRLSNNFSSTTTTGVLTVYNPTGIDGLDELDAIADKVRQRYDSFTITGLASDAWHRFTGDYNFSGYTEGYDQSTGFNGGETRYSDYASYTGVSGKIVYFETGVTGWVLGSGNAMPLESGDFIAELTGAQSLLSFNTGKISVLDMNSSTKRKFAVPSEFSGFDLSSFQNYTRGVTNHELSAIAPEQITEISVTGIVTNLDYGCLISGFNRPEILPLVKLGSAAKFQIKNASPFFYKVISMKEENPNEYLVTATKYDTGKFNLIDENISIEHEANTYSYQVAQTINGVTYETLAPPTFVGNVTTGIPNATDQTFNITANWTTVADVTGYGVKLTLPNGQILYTDTKTPDISLSGLNQVGVFNVGVNALGNMGSDGGNAYYDSPYRNTGIFVLYEDALVYSKSFLNKITIL
jgi:hypothetical protein